jgi:hypothetical protein
MKLKYKTFQAEVKAFDDENLILEHFISTEHKDRGGDVMRAKGMKVVGNPVVLLLHGRGSMGSEPIGKPLSITVDEFKGQPGILAKTQFFPDEVGTRLYKKAKGGFLPNWSIGYAVDEAKDIMEDGRYAGRDVTKWQLFEYSPVGVPMNPFAQTIKEFLDKVEKGEDVKIEESRWFGFVDSKECKECGQECEKHGSPPPDQKTGSQCATCGKDLCKKWSTDGPPYRPEKIYCEAGCEYPLALPGAEEKPFANEHSCRVKDPDQFPKKRRENNKFGEGIHAIWGIKDDKAQLQAIRFSVDKFTADQAKKWAKDHDHTCILFEPATGKEEQIPEAEPELLAKIAEDEKSLTIEIRVTGLEEAIASMNNAVNSMIETYKKLEPLLKTLPPEPDGGGKGDEEHHDNPPEKKAPPRLVIVRDEDTPEAKQKAMILAAMREVYVEVVKQEIDRMKGRVP